MNTWSNANHCKYPDEYAAEHPADEDGTSTHGGKGGGGGNGGGDGRNNGVNGMNVGPGGLLARNSNGSKQKANGRLSYRDILFNNDGKYRPPYSAGPCASASAEYLFPRPRINVVDM